MRGFGTKKRGGKKKKPFKKDCAWMMIHGLRGGRHRLLLLMQAVRYPRR
jgi:hypothetical protein